MASHGHVAALVRAAEYVERPVGDHLRGGDVAVFNETAVLATVHALVERLRCRRAARRAPLACSVRVHAHEDVAGLLNFVLEAAHEIGPALVEDLAIQPSLLPDMGTWLLQSAPSRADEVADRQILHSEHRVLTHQPTGDGVMMRAASAADPLIHAGEVACGAPSTARALPTTTDPAVGAPAERESHTIPLDGLRGGSKGPGPQALLGHEVGAKATAPSDVLGGFLQAVGLLACDALSLALGTPALNSAVIRDHHEGPNVRTERQHEGSEVHDRP